MKVLVTGAGGFIGSHVAGALLKAGHSVRGLTRKFPLGIRFKEGVEYITDVDVSLSTTMTAKMFEGVDAVVHLVGIITEGAHGQTFPHIHVDGTQNLVDAAFDGGFLGRFVYVSALGAAADAASEYSRTKYAAEAIVIKSGLPYTIFRPSLVMGADGEFVKQMSDLVQHGGVSLRVPFPFIPIPGDGENRFQPIAVGDLAGCIVGCLADPATANQLYEVGGASQVTFNELALGFAQHLGVSKPLVHVPLSAMNVGAAFLEALVPKPPITRDQILNLGRDNVTDSPAVEEVFGIRPLTFEQILSRIYAK